MGNIGDITYLCEGRDLFARSENEDEKQEVGDVISGAVTGGVPEGERLRSVRRIATDIRDGLIVLTLGIWCAVLAGEGPASKMADAVEGWLIGRSRKVPSGPALFSLELEGEPGTIVVLLNEPEGAVLVEELHRALGALERLGEGDPREDAPTRDEDDPDDRDDGCAAEELEMGRGAGGLVTLDEVCS